MIACAKLVLYCLQNNIEPKWLATNPESERLAVGKSTLFRTFY